MSIDILRPCDIEDEIRKALTGYLTTYCRPLPAEYTLPNIIPVCVGGGTNKTIDTFMVRLDVRAETDAEADEYLRNALGLLEAQVKAQFGALRHIQINSLANWGTDPMRPDLKLRTMTVLVTAHRESVTITNS